MKDYYHILQVPRDADTAQIRAAFRALSKRYHPDRNGGSRRAEERFKEINEAYQVLKDPARRAHSQWRRREAAQKRSARRDWPPHDYASRAARRNHAWNEPPGAGFDGAWASVKHFFSCCAMVVILLMPFFLAGRSAHVEERTSNYARLARCEAHYDYSPDFMRQITRRFQSELSHLDQIRQSDPSLKGLDLDSGFYRGNGRTVKLSWDVLQLVREKEWKF
jgi:curved DNA-binding protein CbpA